MVPIDGLWIDMNEPANFCDGSCYPNVNEIDEDQSQLRMGYKHTSFEDDSFDPRNPLYKINNAGSQAPLQVKTVSADARHYNNTLHYDLHNLYGHTESIMTRKALLDVRPNKRPFVLSRSTFAGTGVHAGHWTGDNWSSWEHLYYSIPSMLSFQFFGIPLVGADICGRPNAAMVVMLQLFVLSISLPLRLHWQRLRGTVCALDAARRLLPVLAQPQHH